MLVRIQVPPSPDPSPDSARAHVFGYKTKLQRAVFELERKAFLGGGRKMERSRLRARSGRDMHSHQDLYLRLVELDNHP